MLKVKSYKLLCLKTFLFHHNVNIQTSFLLLKYSHQLRFVSKENYKNYVLHFIQNYTY